MQEILLREPDLTLTQCIDWCRAAEQTKIQSQKIEKYKLNVGYDIYEKDIKVTGCCSLVNALKNANSPENKCTLRVVITSAFYIHNSKDGRNGASVSY